MNPVDKVFVLELNNESTLIGSGIDEAKRLLIVKNPAWLYEGSGRLCKLACNPKEIAVNSLAILLNYITDDQVLIAQFNRLWESKNGKNV